MFKKTLLVAALSLASSGAFAQGPPMDMSWGIASQMRYQVIGNQMAYNTAMQYYQYMQRLRAMGYNGPSLPTGVTPQSLQASINSANAATQRYIRGSQYNSARTSAAIYDYNMRAIRGCYYGYDAYGRVGYVCP